MEAQSVTIKKYGQYKSFCRHANGQMERRSNRQAKNYITPP